MDEQNITDTLLKYLELWRKICRMIALMSSTVIARQSMRCKHPLLQVYDGGIWFRRETMDGDFQLVAFMAVVPESTPLVSTRVRVIRAGQVIARTGELGAGCGVPVQEFFNKALQPLSALNHHDSKYFFHAKRFKNDGVVDFLQQNHI